MSKTQDLKVYGHADEGYENVVAEFENNFKLRGDLGAAVCIFVDGRMVVDLWGGVADRHTDRPWERATRALTHSCSKGVTSVCLMMLVDRGLLDPDSPVSRYWPEFEAAGKRDMTVRVAIDHSGGLPYLDADLSLSDLAQWESVVDAIARQAPAWSPGEGFAYHAHTFGWIAGELIRRVSGRRPGAFLAEEVAKPLNLDCSFGVRDRSELAALARIEPQLPSQDEEVARQVAQIWQEHPFWMRALTLDGAIPFPGFGDDDEAYNSPEVLLAEMPSVNLVTSARDLAKIYAACIGEVDGVRLLSDRTSTDAMRYRSGGGKYEFVLPPELRWGTGFMIDSPPVRPMLGPTSFGHDGAAGQLGFANVEARTSFGYVTNQMGGIPDDRANALTAALSRALGR